MAIVEYNVPLELSENDKINYIEWSKVIKQILDRFNGTYKIFKDIFKNDYEVITGCIYGANYKQDFQYYRLDSNSIRTTLSQSMGWSDDLDTSTPYGESREVWKPDNILEIAKEFIHAVSTRNNILIHNNIKLNAIIEILKLKFPTTICFNESTEFAELVSEVVNKEFNKAISMCYHGNIKSKELVDMTGTPILYTSGKHKGKPKKFGKTALKAITNRGFSIGAFKLLCTDKSLDSKLTISNVEQVISTSVATTPFKYKQKKDKYSTVTAYNPNKLLVVINLYFDDFKYITYDSGDKEEITINSREKQRLLVKQENTNNIVEFNNLSELLKIIQK